MSVNDYRSHLMVIPEDEANRQIANGFALEVMHGRRIEVLREAGGWLHVCEDFLKNHQSPMRQLPNRHIVLLLEFDDSPDRRSNVMGKIPGDLTSRVFLLGVRSEPEALRRACSIPFEALGRSLAVECRDGSFGLWQHDLLRENAGEIDRLRTGVRPFLFDPD